MRKFAATRGACLNKQAEMIPIEPEQVMLFRDSNSSGTFYLFRNF